MKHVRYYIIRRKLLHYQAASLFHYQAMLLHDQAVITLSGVFITLTGDYYIIAFNNVIGDMTDVSPTQVFIHIEPIAQNC